MAIITRIGKSIALWVLLLLATATTRVVEAKVSISNNVALSSSFQAATRTLEKASIKDASTNDIDYVPYENGTEVQFQDQDGTWMLGIIYKYNSNTQTYTIQWDEDYVNEDFSDLEKVEEMVRNAEENGDFAENSREQEENDDYTWDFDFGYSYTYQDLSDYEPWDLGTETMLEFSDGWYQGKITEFIMSDDKKNATYIVTWSDGTSDVFYNELEWMDLMVASAEDYEPWEIGTPAFGYPDDNAANSEDPYLSGKITSFKNGAYTITWSNGDVVLYNDFDMVDQLVNNAATNIDSSWLDNYDPWPKGTPVTWPFDDGWWNGTITDFSMGSYEVTWSDGSSKYYSSLEKIDQMVAFNAGGGFMGNLGDDDTQYDDYTGYDNYVYGEYYDLQTVVYAEFKDGWWAGYIDSYEGEYYIVRWSDDTVDKFLPGEDMDEMVLNGKHIPADYGIWPIGTRVYKEFDGDWYWGTIEYSEGGFYTILWEDGERTTYVSGSEIDQMVKDAYKGGMGTFAKSALIILVLGCVGGIAFFVIKRKKTKKRSRRQVTESVRESELDLTEENEHRYSDHEDEVLGIPSFS